jgi:HEAT repeat protein
MRPALQAFSLAAAALAACSCASPEPPAERRPPDPAEAASLAAARRAAEERDLLQQLEDALAQPREDPALLMNNLEHLLPAWEAEQRRGREAPLENLVTLKVVPNVDTVLEALESGPRERKIVAAWALGFARVPENDEELESPHPRALAALSRGLESRDDAVLRNVLLGLWKLGDTATPLRPLLELMVQHHDPDVRSNATLALGAVLTWDTLPAALNSLLVALADREPKVRLHAAAVAARFPGQATTDRLLAMLPSEETPLVRASMAAALGAARSRAAVPLLLPLLGGGREVEARAAREALTAILGVDRGPNASDWASATAPPP